MTITHADGSKETRPALGVVAGSKAMRNAAAVEARRAAKESKQAWRQSVDPTNATTPRRGPSAELPAQEDGT